MPTIKQGVKWKNMVYANEFMPPEPPPPPETLLSVTGNTISTIDSNTGEVLASFTSGEWGSIERAALKPGSDRIVAIPTYYSNHAGYYYAIQVVDIVSGEQLWRGSTSMYMHPGAHDIQWSNDGSLLVAWFMADNPGHIDGGQYLVWEALAYSDEGTVVAPSLGLSGSGWWFNGQTSAAGFPDFSMPGGVAISPDNTMLAISRNAVTSTYGSITDEYTYQLRIVNLSTQTEVTTLLQGRWPKSGSVLWSDDGSRLIVVHNDRIVWFSTTTWDEVGEFNSGSGDPIYKMKMSPNKAYIVACAADEVFVINPSTMDGVTLVIPMYSANPGEGYGDFAFSVDSGSIFLGGPTKKRIDITPDGDSFTIVEHDIPMIGFHGNLINQRDAS